MQPSDGYAAAAGERGLDIDEQKAREIIYGMPYAEWKAKYHTEATPEKQAVRRIVVGDLNASSYCRVNTGWKLLYTGAWKLVIGGRA